MIQARDIKIKLIFSEDEFRTEMQEWDLTKPVVADVETCGLDPKDGKLLGIALCSIERPDRPIYVVVQHYDHATSQWNTQWPVFDKHRLPRFLESFQLVGHNYAYDKLWLDHVFQVDTKWKACTRLMWHLASAPAGPRPYGLKDAQVELLGWGKRGDEELAAQVVARGGSIKGGGHYLADVDVMGKYACLDAASTALLYNRLSSFFDKHDYWWMLEKMVTYSWLLQECTNAGILVDVDALERQVTLLSNTREAYAARFFELAEGHIERLERFWREDRSSKYISLPARERFLASWDLQKKFKISSDKDKRELFYDSVKLPIVVQTDGGKPSTGVDAVKIAVRESGRSDLAELMEAYEQVETAETLLNSFAKPWAESLKAGRLHPRFNPCGTVSYRLSGFKPQVMNLPFAEQELMSCLMLDDGWTGVHADFASIEPCVTAHYSQDPSLLKVFRDGLGDVYLDLALTLFPNDTALRSGYDPRGNVTGEIKEHFKHQRQIAKVIQLAVQYGGTKHAVSKNLSYSGIPTTLGEADALVQAYWRHFRRVAVANEAIFRRYQRDGFIRNVVGRIIRVPNPRYKDLPNRFYQSGAHDLLSFWVLRIENLIRERRITAKPVIVDLHDSTSWASPKEQAPALEQVFRDALAELNAEVRMSVSVKIDLKHYRTLAGLKNAE